MINEKLKNAIDKVKEVSKIEFSEEQNRIFESTSGMYIDACAGSGKALVNGTSVLTPKGYVPIEQLKIGDKVYDRYGKEQRVIGVFPQGKKQVYKVTFDSNTVIECCKDHLWTCYVGKGLKRRTINTHNMMKRLEDSNLIIPSCAEVDFKPTVHLSVEPEQVAHLIMKLSKTKAELLETDKYVMNMLGLTEGNIFVPEEYKLGSIENRKMFIYTVIKYADSDYVDEEETRAYSIGVKNETLLKDIVFIASTLGMYTRVEGDTIYIRQNRHYGRKIVNIEPTSEYKEMTCIQVTGESKLYLTQDCIPTHNTTVLTNLVAIRTLSGIIKDASKVLCTTYSVTGADTLTERINELFGKLGIRTHMTVKTIHASYLEILHHFGYEFNIINNGQRLKYIREACSEASARMDEEDINTIDTLLSYQVNNLMSDKQLVYSPVYKLQNVSLTQYSNIRSAYNKKKQDEGVIDFDDMQLYVYMLMVKNKNQDVISYCRNRWKYFLIDESQDISKVQFAILRQMAVNPDDIVFVGDIDQCIYQWRGADPSLLLNIGGYYDILRYNLSTNYRCKSNIVSFAQKGIRYNENRIDKDMKAHKEGGIVSIINASGESNYKKSLQMYYYIDELIKNGVNPKDIAVIARNGNQISVLHSMLMISGIYSITSKDDIKLTKNLIYTRIKDIAQLANDGIQPYVTSRALWLITIGLGVAKSREIGKLQDMLHIKLSSLLGYILKYYTSRTVPFNQEIKVPKLIEAKIEGFANTLKTETIDYLALAYKLLINPDVNKRMLGLLDMYSISCAFMYKKSSSKDVFEGIIDYIKSIIRQKGYSSLSSFFRTSEQLDTNKLDVMCDRVTLTTMHSSKGSEFEHVLVLDELCLTDEIQKLITDKRKREEIDSTLEEETRLRYVSYTRAKEHLALFTPFSKPSPFILECMQIIQKAEVYSLIEMQEIPVTIAKKFAEEVKNKYSFATSEVSIGKDSAIFNQKEAEEEESYFDTMQSMGTITF